MKVRSNILASGLVSKRPVMCRLYAPDVHWPSRHGRAARTDSGSHRIPYSTPPTGDLVRRVFGGPEDWNDGELDSLAWANGTLNPLIENAIYRKPPDFWKITGSVSCYGCEGRDWCKFWGNPLEKRTERLLEYRIFYSRVYPVVWESLDKHLQRAIILLSLFGISGQRPDGYHSKDLRSIIGVHGQALTRIKQELDLMGIVHLKRGRYRFSGSQTKGEKLYVVNKSNRATDLFYAKYLRTLTDSIQAEVKVNRFTNFKQKERYNLLPLGTSIGRQPPQWFLELLSEFLSLLKYTWTYHFDARIIRVEDKDWRERGRFNKGREKLDLSNRPESAEGLTRAFGESLARILELEEEFTEDNAREWLDFCKLMGIEITQDSFKISRRSTFLLDVAEIDMRRTRTLQGGRVMLTTAPRERERKRTWSLYPPIEMDELLETDVKRFLNW